VIGQQMLRRSLMRWGSSASPCWASLVVDPVAAACAVTVPTCLTSVAIVSGAAPFLVPGCVEGINPMSRQFFDLCRTKPLRGRLLLRRRRAIPQ
jgi:hypothetical protein